MEYNGYDINQESKVRSRFLIGVIAVVGLVLIVAAAVLISFGVRQSKYNSAIKNANHYYSTGNYHNAIVWYENAIEIDDKQENVYLKLASTHILLGDYISADHAIDRGLKRISSGKLQQKKAEIQLMIVGDLKAQMQTQEEIKSLTSKEIQDYSAGISIEKNIFDMIAAYTYTEYYRDFGEGLKNQNGNTIVMSYAINGMKASYYNIDKEKVVDMENNVPFGNAKPVEVSFDNLRKLFASKSEKFVVSYEKILEIFGDTVQLHQNGENGMHYISAEYKKCRIQIQTDENGNIVSETAWNKLEPMQRGTEQFESGVEGEIQGYIIDATTGRGMKAELIVRERGKKVGTAIAELESKSDGSYVYGGKEGRYTMEVSAKGYITEFFDMEIINNQVKTGEDVVLSPEVEEGEIRIVLTWGSTPTDLDSYAIGTSSEGKDFCISYFNSDEKGIGNLDVDDTNSYGPETITITDIGATFTYSVVDFLSEGTLGGSDATVKVYLPGESSAIKFNVPSGSGLVWHVFEYENGEIKRLNDLSNDVDRVGAKR